MLDNFLIDKCQEMRDCKLFNYLKTLLIKPLI